MNGISQYRFIGSKKNRSLQERNDLYIKLGTEFGSAAIRSCLHSQFLNEPVSEKEIDAMIVVSSSGMATPSLDARMMNQLPFSIHTKRIPIWGLGCAGGAAGLSRAYEYCRAFRRKMFSSFASNYVV